MKLHGKCKGEKSERDLQLTIEGAELKIRLKKWIQRYWGKRCPDYESSCMCCNAWASFDSLTSNALPSDPDL